MQKAKTLERTAVPLLQAGTVPGWASQDGPPRTTSACCVSGDVRGGTTLLYSRPNDLGRWMALKWETFRFLLSSCTHPNSTAEASRLCPIHPCPFLKAQAQLQ